MKGMCSCGHHRAAMLLSVLTWLLGIAFFWASWNSTGFVMGFDADYYFKSVVVLALLMMGMRNCNCCCERACCGTCPVQMEK